MALPSYKDIIELIKKGATVEAQEQIMALREAAPTLQEDNFALRERVRAIEEELRLKDSLVFDGTSYYMSSDEPDDPDGPFCQRCYDVEKKLVRLQNWDETTYACFSCKMN